MGTNYYLRRVKPREVYDEYHIAKCSAGWKVHFQDSTEYRWEDEAPSYHSVGDIEELLASGEYQLSNEYGDVAAPGEESIAQFRKICHHELDGDESAISAEDYKDTRGYLFSPQEFC